MVRRTAAVVKKFVSANPDASGIDSIVVAAHALQRKGVNVDALGHLRHIGKDMP